MLKKERRWVDTVRVNEVNGEWEAKRGAMLSIHVRESNNAGEQEGIIGIVRAREVGTATR